MSIKDHFLALWIDTIEAHVTTSAHQLDRRQVEYKDHGVTVTDNDKVDHFVAQMYACCLFEAKFLDEWEETADKKKPPTSHLGQHNPTSRGSSTRRVTNWSVRIPRKPTKAVPCSAKLPTPTLSSLPKEGWPTQRRKKVSTQIWNTMRRWRRRPTRRPSASLIFRTDWMAKPSSPTLHMIRQARCQRGTTRNWPGYGWWLRN